MHFRVGGRKTWSHVNLRVEDIDSSINMRRGTCELLATGKERGARLTERCGGDVRDSETWRLTWEACGPGLSAGTIFAFFFERKPLEKFHRGSPINMCVNMLQLRSFNVVCKCRCPRFQRCSQLKHSTCFDRTSRAWPLG